MRGLRRNQSIAEEKLWFNLRDRQLNGIKFRRQQSLGKYIVDLISFETKLIIEIDGGQHNELLKINKDKLRTEYLEGRGYQVLRFWNNEVLENMDGVLFKISEAIMNKVTPSPALSSQSREPS